tara:strand:+ start:817 stop:972 length:156 start_codon:yes stop_codon:yes gene_type:complete
MISEEIVIGACIIYIIGVGFCANYISSYGKNINCFGRNKETNLQNDEYTLV